MLRRVPEKLLRGLYALCLISLAGMLMSTSPVMALNPPTPCEPGDFTAYSGIVVSIDGPTTSIAHCVKATFTANAVDRDYCPNSRTRVSDTVDKFTWYIDGTLYAPGNDQKEISLTFTGGSHTVRVVADDHWYFADDSPKDATVSVSVLSYDQTYDKVGHRATSCDARGVRSMSTMCWAA